MPLPNRHTPRAKWHKYNGAEYFVTICTNGREHYFGEVCDGQTQLTAVGECLKREIENTKTIRGDYVEIPLYVIMPNHVHLIVIIHGQRRTDVRRDALNASAHTTNTDARGLADARSASLQQFGPQSENLGAVIRGIKSAVTRFARENNIPFAWQSRYHDHIVRSQNEMNRIAEYIEQNPARWESDCFYNVTP